jgi:hypothetical protein
VVQQPGGQALAGIAVHCLQAGRIVMTTTSAADGSYQLFDPYACEQLLFEDRDGPANLGLHQGRAAAYDPEVGPPTVALETRPD